MPIVMMPVETKRPKEATPDHIFTLRNAGIPVKEIAKLYNVTPTRIYAILAKLKTKTTGQQPKGE